MKDKPLTQDNYLIFAIKNYTNPHCIGLDEFNSDIRIFATLKKYLTRYQQDTNDLKERTIVNLLITLYNLFGLDATNRLLFFILNESYWVTLKTFLVYLNKCPVNIHCDIPIDGPLMKILESL